MLKDPRIPTKVLGVNFSGLGITLGLQGSAHS